MGRLMDAFEGAPDAPAEQAAQSATKGGALMQEFESAFAPQAAAPVGPDEFAGQTAATAIPQNPDSAVQKVAERFATGFGNTAGTVDYLKGSGRYEDVTYDPEKGVLMKKGGKWYQYDPSGGGIDPWDLSERLADIVEFAAPATAPALLTTVAAPAFAAAGTAVAPGAGTAAGGVTGILAAGAAGAVVNQNLGRLFGTYKATPDEELRDMAWDSVLNLAGVGLAKGLGIAGKALYAKTAARPTGRMVLEALENIGAAAARPVKEMTKGILKMTGANKAAVETLVDEPVAVTARMSKYLRGPGQLAKSGDAVRQELAEDSISAASDYLEKAPKFLFRRFDALEKDLLSDPAIARVNADVQAPIRRLFQKLSDDGWIEPQLGTPRQLRGISQTATREVTERAAQSASRSGAAAGLRTAEGEVAAGARAAASEAQSASRTVRDQLTQKIMFTQGKAPKFGYRVKSFDDLVEQLTDNDLTDSKYLVKQAVSKLGSFVEEANQLLKAGRASGADGARQILTVRRALDKFYYSATESNPFLKKQLGPLWQEARQELSGAFKVPGTRLGDKYARMNDFFTQNYEYVQDAARIARVGMKGTNLQQVHGFLDKVYRGSDPAAKAQFERIFKLGGDYGAAVKNRIMTNNAASEFTRAFPHMDSGFIQKSINMAVRGAVIQSAAYMSAPLAVPVALAMSPRGSAEALGLAARTASAEGAGAALKYLPYLKQFRDNVALLPRKEKEYALRDPEFLPRMAAAAEKAALAEDEVRETLLQQGGVK